MIKNELIPFFHKENIVNIVVYPSFFRVIIMNIA